MQGTSDRSYQSAGRQQMVEPIIQQEDNIEPTHKGQLYFAVEFVPALAYEDSGNYDGQGKPLGNWWGVPCTAHYARRRIASIHFLTLEWNTY